MQADRWENELRHTTKGGNQDYGREPLDDIARSQRQIRRVGWKVTLI